MSAHRASGCRGHSGRTSRYVVGSSSPAGQRLAAAAIRGEARPMSTSARQLLDDRLRALTAACKAVFSFVIDTSGEVYGATEMPDDWEELTTPAEPLVMEAMRAHPLRRGGHLHLVRSAEAPFVGRPRPTRPARRPRCG